MKRYRVNIPAGVREGSRIKLAARARPGLRGGPRAICTCHPRDRVAGVQAQGRQLRGRGPITVAEALGGAEVEVPTLHGTKKLRVAPGTKHGTLQRLRGEGPPILSRFRPGRPALSAS
jgi:molecular chaperone DnaJ